MTQSNSVGNGVAAGKPYAIPGPTSPQSGLIGSGQQYIVFPTFTLESGIILHDIPLAYKTWGTLDPQKRNNALVVCHAFTGSADVEDWWGPLLGPGKLFDPTRFFIICTNVLGSPYGSAGPCTRKEGHRNPIEPGWDGQGWWGPEFPATTVRDDVRIAKGLLDFLNVEQIAAVVGGSMGGMSVLEWGLMYPVRFPADTPSRADEDSESSRSSDPQAPYIRAIIPIATSARHSAWCISWSEAQRQSIYSDPLFDHGYYSPDKQPRSGLSAARMAALLTYRSRDSFESRFGRRTGGPNKGGGSKWQQNDGTRRGSLAQHAAQMHNEGNQSPRLVGVTNGSNSPSSFSAIPPPVESAASNGSSSPPDQDGITTVQAKPFSAQSYLRYQGDKFVNRFDANCYVHLTRKMDAFDVARGRAHWGLPATSEDQATETAEPIEVSDVTRQPYEKGIGEKRLPREGQEDDVVLARVLALLSSNVHRQGAPSPQVLIASVESDGLFAPPEQATLHEHIKGSKMVMIQSSDGHDGFLLEFDQINSHAQTFLRAVLPDIYEGKGVGFEQWQHFGEQPEQEQGENRVVKESMSGEVEDLTRW